MSEEFSPVKLEEIKSYITVELDGGNRKVLKEYGWKDLNDLEQEVIELIIAGKYYEASELTDHGKAETYDKKRLRNFLIDISIRHDPSLASAFSNDHVRAIISA